jgi:signal transduction histidine kinase
VSTSRFAVRRIQFVVSDTGVGIPENKLAAIFHRFRQVSKDRRGLGFGLHNSKSIVEAHGGRIWAKSQVAVGSTFYVELPVAPVSG